jgi:hypothetical protein
MDKANVAEMCYWLRVPIEKQNTKYPVAVPIEVRVCCCLYKLAHGANFLSCSEKFAIGRSIMSLVIREVVSAINFLFKNVIQWPRGDDMRQTMLEFKSWCGMPSVQGAIDCIHIAIPKPPTFPEDYWYYKTRAYSMVAQAVVDAKKLFTNVYIGLPGPVNDQRVLRRSSLWQKVVHRGLMNVDAGYQEGIPPYLLGDKGYPLLSWLIVPFKDDRQPRSLAEIYFNNRHWQGRSVVEKENWREMGKKLELQ